MSNYPQLLPLQKSFDFDSVEQELKKIMIDLFINKLQSKFSDINLCGVPHLASENFIRKIITSYGLALIGQLDNDNFYNNDYALRYLFRTWTARLHNGRGLFFLRLYFKLIYPEIEHYIYQLYALKTADICENAKTIDSSKKCSFMYKVDPLFIAPDCKKINDLMFKSDSDIMWSDPTSLMWIDSNYFLTSKIAVEVKNVTYPIEIKRKIQETTQHILPARLSLLFVDNVSISPSNLYYNLAYNTQEYITIG